MKQDTTGKGLRADLNEIGSHFLDVIFPYAVAFGGLTVALSLYRSWMYGWYLTIVWHLVMYVGGTTAVLLRRHLASSFVLFFMLALISIDVFRSLYSMGLAGSGMTGLTVLSVLAGIFVGIRAGMAFILVGTAAAAVLGGLICQGTIVPVVDSSTYLRSPLAWVSQLSFVVMYAFPLVFTAHILRQRITRWVRDLQEMNDRLRSEISMRRQAEGDFKNSEMKYRNIFEHASEGIFQITTDGRLLIANPAFAFMAGYASPYEMMTGVNDNRDRLLVDETDASGIIERMGRGEPITNLELEVRTKDRRTAWMRLNMRCIFSEDGKPAYYEGTAQDITERKMAEMALQESEVKYRSVVENSLVASYIMQDGVFRFVNSTFSAIAGYSQRELTEGMKPSDIVHPQDRKIWRDAMNGIMRGQPGRLELELRIQTKDRKAVSVKALAGSTSYNGRMAVFGSFIDVSKEKTLEAQLRQAQKMEAIGTLSGGIAHDFNNILTALTGYATLLQMKLDEDDPLRYYVDQIFSASHKATTLTQSLLTFGRRQPINLQPTDLGSIVKGTEALLRRLITEDISLITRFADDEMVILADTSQIDQILFNLVTNARDAMPEGGKLTISTDRAFIGNDFIAANGFGKVGTYAMLSVSDTGIGMDDATKERIFDPFFTTKEFGKGTGLGLSTVYGIVKQHKGYLCVSSLPLHGTTFSIYLPLVKRAREKLRVETPDVFMRHKGSATILVADDNPEVRRFVRDILQQCGYTVIEASDGEDAVNCFTARSDISLVVLDSVMPKRNGRQAYDAMKAIRPSVRALFISGHAVDTILDKGIKEGEVDFIEKPLVPEHFLKKVEDIIARPE